MGKGVIILFVAISVLYIWFVSSACISFEQNDGSWKYNGNTLDEILSNSTLSSTIGKIAIKNAILDKEIRDSDIALAIQKGIVTQEEINQYKDEAIWRFDGKTLDEILKDDSLSTSQKSAAVKKAMLDKEITKEQLGTALEMNLTTAEEAKVFSGENFGLVNYLKRTTKPYIEKTKYYLGEGYDWLDRRLGWLAGSRTFDGEYVVCTAEYWGEAVPFLFVLILVYYLYYPYVNLKEETNGTFNSLYREVTYVESYKGDTSFRKTIWAITKDYFVWDWRPYMIILAYLFFSVIPVFARIVQVITLEALGVNVVIRAVVIGTILAYLPYLWKKYKERRSRRKAYDKAMYNKAAEEAMKARLK